ncbi:MAG: hypothetical protein MJA27_15210 [Pseudanabaenales cyanobacterium]|nr:hypothetical protein [Pseudanabaenales cyanobacterium]
MEKTLFRIKSSQQLCFDNGGFISQSGFFFRRVEVVDAKNFQPTGERRFVALDNLEMFDQEVKRLQNEMLGISMLEGQTDPQGGLDGL